MMEQESYIDWLKAKNWINFGDCVYVVSDILELAKYTKETGKRLVLDDLITGLQEMVGSQGTLLFPTFNWDFCKGVGFDYHKTPVRTGALSKAALKREDFKRTHHPLYSFAVWGDKQEELLQNDSQNAFGQGTIFEKLYDWNCKALVIGIPALQGLTYIHHVEQMVGVPYRYNKNFTGDYTDENGVCTKRTYAMYVRDLDMDPRHINGFSPLEELIMKQGMIQRFLYGTVPTQLVMIQDVDQAVRKDILENDSQNMYHYKKK